MGFGKFLVGIMRPQFLILTPCCVLLGLAVAVWEGFTVNWLDFSLIMLGAIAAHICVNSFNEFFDYKSGLDFVTQRTPFSGGSGTLVSTPSMENEALAICWVSLAITCAVGVYFCIVRGWGLLPLGLAGIILVLAYTSFFNKNPFLCLVAPGLGFGTCMVLGTYFCLTGGYSVSAFLASMIPFFLVSNLLLLNQFPDVDADKTVGRKHLSIIAGRKVSSIVYTSFLFCTYLVIILSVLLGRMPSLSLLGIVSVVLAVPAGIGAFRNSEDTKKLMPAMGMNVVINLITPVLMSVGMFIG
jgi:1,4-dihydroxy-2-naphthoate polyprenyltransferase